MLGRRWVLPMPTSSAPGCAPETFRKETSSICKAAVHAGVIVDEVGGYADVMPVDKKKSYVGSLRNGVQSESLNTPQNGNAFRIFAVRQ